MISNLTIPTPVKAIAKETVNRLKQELASNDRLKWLLGIGIVILYLGLALYMAGRAETAQRDLNSSQIRLSQIKAQALETRWPLRAAEAQALTSELEKRFWPGSTPGLAEAGFERWIRQTFDQHGVQVRQVQLTRGPVLDGDVGVSDSTLSSIQQIRAKVISPLNEIALIRFLNDTRSHQSWLIVEQLIVRPGRNPRLEMDLATYFRPPQPAS